MIEALLRASRAHRRAMLLGALLLGIGASVLATRVRIDADVLRLLPQNGTAIPAFRTFLARFGSLDELYVVFEAPPDLTIDDVGDTIDAFVEHLAAAPEIARVNVGTSAQGDDWTYLTDRVLLLLEPPALRDGLGRFQPDAMNAQLERSRALLALPGQDVGNVVRRDPLGLFQLARDRLAPEGALDLAGAAYRSADGRLQLVRAMPTRPPFDADFTAQLFARLDAIEREVLGAHTDTEARARRQSRQSGDSVKVTYAGGHRIALEAERQVRRETVWNGVSSLALILPLLFVAFRSQWLVAAGAVPSLLALLVVLAGYAVADVSLPAAVAGAAAMLFGLGVDGVVLLFVAFRREASAGLPTEAVVPRLRGPAGSMLLGMWTTAATFYGLLAVDFPSLESLGALIGHAMVLCGVFTLLLIPPLLPSRPPKAPPVTFGPFAAFIDRHAAVILASALAITALAAILAPRLRIDPSLDKLRATGPAATDTRDIATRFGLPHDVYIVIDRGSMLEPLLRTNERFIDRVRAASPTIRWHAPSTLLPSMERQDANASSIAEERLNQADIQQRLETAAARAGFRPGTFDAFVTRLPGIVDPRNRLTYDGFVSHGLGHLVSRSVARSDGEWMLATYVYPRDGADVNALRRALDGTTMTLTGVPEVNRELTGRFAPEFVRGLAVGTLLVVALIWASFRRADLTLLAMAPTVLALIWAAGALAVTGVELDLFSVFAVTTFVGIGVDYGIHLVHRFRDTGWTHRQAIVAELGPVILVAGGITLAGFGTLVSSSYPPLRSLGVISIVLVLSLLISSLCVLPALLTVWPAEEGRTR